MKKLLSVLLVLCLLLGICTGCVPSGSNQTEPSDDPTGNSTGDSTDGTDAPPVLTLDLDTVTLSASGDSVVLYSGSIDADDITWSSDDEYVAMFYNGSVYAVSGGQTTVHAQYGDQKVSCTVICNFSDTTEPDPTDPDSTDPDSTEPDPTDPPVTGDRDPVLSAPTQQVVDGSFFDDAVFIGDSVSLALSYYANDYKVLGKAKFLVQGSYGVTNAVFDKMLMPYRGQDMKIEDAVAATGAKKVFIMLGMNDIAIYKDEDIMNYWGQLLSRIRSTCPDVQIYIQSMTPIWTGGEVGALNNKNVDKYNARLETFAAENDCKFIDIASYMKDSTGGLATAFCSDNYVHLTYAATECWVKVLKAYTGYDD